MDETYNYDEGVNGIGRLTSITDWTGRTDYSYNAAGQLVRQVNNIYGLVFTTSWRFDVAGRPAGMTYPTGLVLTYGYDSQGRLSRVASNMGGNWATLADYFLYQPATDLAYAWRFGNGLPRMLVLDRDGRIVRLSTPARHDIGLAYRSEGTVSAVTDYAYPAMTTAYAFDAADRLDGAARSGDAQTLAWDRSGNLSYRSREAEGGYTYNLDAQSNRLVSWSGAGFSRVFHYNANGDLSSEGRQSDTRSYGYDPFERMNAAYDNGVLVGDYRNNALN